MTALEAVRGEVVENYGSILKLALGQFPLDAGLSRSSSQSMAG